MIFFLFFGDSRAQIFLFMCIVDIYTGMRLTCAMKAVALVSWVARTRKATQRIRTVRKYVAWSVFTFVFICNKTVHSLIMHTSVSSKTYRLD